MWAAPRDDRRLFAVLLMALIALAWLALWVWGQSPYGRFLSHHSLGAVRGNVTLMLVFVAGWTLMVVAMMLPTSPPAVAPVPPAGGRAGVTSPSGSSSSPVGRLWW